MGFNYAIEKAKFEREWTLLRVEYEKAGMSTEKIDIMHDYDWENFKKERIYAIHTQEFREAQYETTATAKVISRRFSRNSCQQSAALITTLRVQGTHGSMSYLIPG